MTSDKVIKKSELGIQPIEAALIKKIPSLHKTHTYEYTLRYLIYPHPWLL